MDALTTFLWFDGQAEPAAKFYTELFPNSSIKHITRAPQNIETEPGSVLVVDFVLNGASFAAMNGGPHYKHSPAVSFVIKTETQEETDRYWDALTANGGQESMCGWLVDRFGVSWQVTPKALLELTNRPDKARAQKVWNAMMTMKKINIAQLEAAYNS